MLSKHLDVIAEQVKSWLGTHHGQNPRHLHKEEVFTLVMIVGRAAGFRVRTEVQARWAKGDPGRPPSLDCGWFHPCADRLIVAWEFDGRDVQDFHLSKPTGNVAKFYRCPAPLKIQVLYSVKNDLSSKPPTRRSAVTDLLGTTVRVISDEELMSGGGIEEIARKAAALL